MKKQSILFTAIFLFGLYGSSSFAQGSLIQDVEDKWADMNFCKEHVLDDPQLDYAIYQNDRNDGKQQTPSSVISQEKLSGQQMRRSSKPRLI